MSVWRMSVIFELDADDLDSASEIGRLIWEQVAPTVAEIDGVKWMLPVGDFKERGEFVYTEREEASIDR